MGEWETKKENEWNKEKKEERIYAKLQKKSPFVEDNNVIM